MANANTANCEVVVADLKDSYINLFLVRIGYGANERKEKETAAV